ncbi:hypothetical protein AX16_001651 [Volvariella volvacea WC 439]|nr:hypothetical protein AX16_001651 [Volvariella volvacea WC 439]
MANDTSPPVRSPASWGDLSWLERIQIIFHLLQLPFYILYRAVKSPFWYPDQSKPWRRVIGDATLRHMTNGPLSMRQLQSLFGTSEGTYTSWAKRWNQPVLIENIEGEERAKLCWIGKKKTDKVILYAHGGGYFIPMQYMTLSFWLHVQRELHSKGIEAGIAVLSYSLFPESPFPTPLCQLVRAITHLISTGVSPANIHLVGDSAGGNLLLSLISHILHPIPPTPARSRVPCHDNTGKLIHVDINPAPLTLSEPLGGMYMMSPWVSLTALGQGNTYAENSKYDMFGQGVVVQWGDLILTGAMNEGERAYLEVHESSPSVAHGSGSGAGSKGAAGGEGWFSGLGERVAKRVLVTAGEVECFRGDIVAVVERMRRDGSSGSEGTASVQGEKKGRPGADVKLIVQKRGIHDDPYLDFVWWHKGLKVVQLTGEIVDWLAEGMRV